MNENEIPFGKQCFPEKVTIEAPGGEMITFVGVDNGEICIDFPEQGIAGVEYYIDEFLVTVLTKAHPVVKELVRVARETVITLRGNDLNSSANKLAAFLAPFENKE